MDRQDILKSIGDSLCVPDADIRKLSETLWRADGSPPGDGVEYWLQAERELIALAVLKRAVLPATQEAAALIQEEAQRYAQSAVKVLQQELLNNQQLVLPEGVRFHKRVGQVDYLVIEHQPIVRTILVDAAYHQGRIGADRYGSGARHKKYRIALPYIVYQITLSNHQMSRFYMAFRTEPLKSLKDPLGINVLPNSHEGGTVCCPTMGSTANNIVDAVNQIIGTYWQAEFRYCLHQQFPKDPAFKTFEAWEEATAANPLFVLQVQWPKLMHTLTDWLGNVAKEEAPPAPASFQELSSKFVRAATDILSIKDPPKKLTVEEIVKRDLDLCLANIKKGIWPEGMYAQS